MAPKPNFILSATLLLTLLSTTTTLPFETISNAVDTLQNSGYIAMSLTLNNVSNSLLSKTTSATIFTPPDLIFAESGQPSLNLIQYHFSPLIFSSSSLRSLLPGTRIPTMLSDNFLYVTSTSSSDQIMINDVRISDSMIFDDGVLTIFGTENFFDPNSVNFRTATSPAASVSGCVTAYSNNNASFHNAGNVLISRGYSVMASFLKMQLLGLGLGFESQSERSLTVFAPVDEVMVDYSDRFPDYPALFLRHVLPCKVSLKEFVGIENRTSLVMNTYLSGFSVDVTSSGGVLKVNEVRIVNPDMYVSDWLVIHGVSDVVSILELEDDVDESDGGSSELIVPVDTSRDPDGGDL